MKKQIFVITIMLCLFAWSCSTGDSTSDKGKQLKTVTTPSGLKYIDMTEGTGASASSGQTVVVHYVGTLDNGEEFDSSVRRNKAFDFRLGAGNVIKGWDEGIVGMKIGGKRKLIIPPELGYGARKVGSIPANSTLIFEVELLEIR